MYTFNCAYVHVYCGYLVVDVLMLLVLFYRIFSTSLHLQRWFSLELDSQPTGYSTQDSQTTRWTFKSCPLSCVGTYAAFVQNQRKKYAAASSGPSLSGSWSALGAEGLMWYTYFLKRFYNRGNNETNLYLHFRWYQSGWEGSGFSWNVNPPLRYLFSNRLPRRAKQVFSAFVFFSFHLCQFLCYMFPDPWAKKHLALICAYRKKWVSSRYLTQNNFSLRHTHDLTENFLANFVILPINRRENKNCS